MEVLIPPDKITLAKIKIELRIEDDRFLRQIELFQAWLKCEPYLPKILDRRVIENFISLCKCDLEKAKQKFEKFLIANARFKFPCFTCDEKFFDKYAVEREIITLPYLTSTGYRIIAIRFGADSANFDFEKFIVFGITMCKYMLYEDTLAGYIVIYDLINLNNGHFAKINFKAFSNAGDLLISKFPFRIKEGHFLNSSPITQVFIGVIKKILGEKLSKRVIVHQKPTTLENFLSTLLPKEQEVNTESLYKFGDGWKNLLMNSSDWHEKAKNIRLMGSVHPESSDVNSIEEFGVNGTFRQLSID